MTDGPCKFPGECETLEGDHCERCYGKRPHDRELVRRVIEHAKSTPVERIVSVESGHTVHTYMNPIGEENDG